jgi:hypothetical protein
MTSGPKTPATKYSGKRKMILEKTSSKKSSKQIITKYISGSPKINMYRENDG